MVLAVFDLHGTLEMGNKKAVVLVTNAVLESNGLSERLTEQQCDAWYGLKWPEYFVKLLPGMRSQEHVLLAEEAFQYSDDHFWDTVAPCLTPTPYSHDLIKDLLAEGNHAVLISNTKPVSVVQYRKALGLDLLFMDPHAIAVSNHHPDVPDTKEDALGGYIAEQGLERELVVSVGDSEGDVTLGWHFGGKGVLYAHNLNEMRKCPADYSSTDMRDIGGYIRSLN